MYISICTCIYMCEYIGGHSISFFLVFFFFFSKKKKGTMATAGDVLCGEQCIIFAKTVGKHVLT